MKCPHCEFERAESFAFCPKCGKPSTRNEEPITVTNTPRVLAFVKDDLFLTICIVLTASVGCSLLSGGFNVLMLLITIFSWLTYAGGRKNIAKHKHIKVISGSVYAIYVINNVIAIITAVCGVIYTISIFATPILGGFSIEELISENLVDKAYGPLAIIPLTIVALISALAMVLGVILIVLSIIILIINVAGCKKIHLLIKSIYKSAEAGEENFVAADKVQTWIIVFAVLSIIAAITYIAGGQILEFLSEGAIAAALILFSILVGKHLRDK